MALTLAGLWGLASAWRVLTTGKHPSPEVSSALTVPSNALQWISGWNDSAQSQFSTSKGYTVFRMPAPPSIFWKVGGGYAVETEVVLRITAAQPSDICNQFFTSEKIPSLFLHYTSAFSLSEPLLISSFGSLHAYMSDLYYPFVWIVSASEQQSYLHLCLDKKFTG